MTLLCMFSVTSRNRKGGKVPAGKSPRGFALVVTLTLMVLLSLLAVGLLSLSSVTLRQTAQGDHQREANASARLALMMAIGQLQELAGDDRRVTVTGDQRKGSSNGATSAAKDGRRHWAGVYESWSPDAGVDPSAWPERPAPTFLGWLVSGGSERLNKDLVETVASPENVLLVAGRSRAGCQRFREGEAGGAWFRREAHGEGGLVDFRSGSEGKPWTRGKGNSS